MMLRACAVVASIAMLCPVRVVAAAGQRPVTQRDSIELLTLADPLYVNAGMVEAERIATFSPDGSQFVVVLRHGDVESDTNVYSLLLWSVNDAASTRSPQKLLEIASRSNRGNLIDLRWRDARTITFLAARGDDPHQVYRLDTSSRSLTQLTRHPTDVLAYDIDETGERIAYLATRAAATIWDETTSRDGVVVSTQYVEDLITGQVGNAFRGRESETEAYLQADGRAERIRFGRDLPEVMSSSSAGAISISPNGRFLVAATVVPSSEVPLAWRSYESASVRANLQLFVDAQGVSGIGHPGPDWSYLLSYELFDLSKRESRVLLDAPLDASAVQPPLWSSDSTRVFLSGVLPPLGIAAATERSGSLSEPVSLELGPLSGRYTELGSACVRVLRWNSERTEVTCRAQRTAISAAQKEVNEAATGNAPGDSTAKSNCGRSSGTCGFITLRKRGQSWSAVRAAPARGRQCTVELLQDMNTPPRLYFECGGRKPHLLMNLNPQLAGVALAKVREVKWQSAPNYQSSAGLYWPPGVPAGTRVPLIIQTHGWNPDAFWMDGFSTTGYAAQALAAKGFAVLQLMETFIPPEFGEDGQLKEVQRALGIYESAIAHLDEQGFIDRSRVGIVGFSHTNLYVQYALSRRPNLFAAASIGEGEGGGYLEFMTRRNAYVDARSLYGGPPLGAHLSRWLELAPAFNAHRVSAPVRIVANQPRLVLVNWEWYESLQLQKKPVDFVLLRDGEHVLMRPSERLVSQQGNVDWFDYWLNGRRDPDASKDAQYERWQHLCEQYLERHPGRKSRCAR